MDPRQEENILSAIGPRICIGLRDILHTDLVWKVIEGLEIHTYVLSHPDMNIKKWRNVMRLIMIRNSGTLEIYIK